MTAWRATAFGIIAVVVIAGGVYVSFLMREYRVHHEFDPESGS